MPRATEKCGCGASIEVITDHDSRVRTALEEWRRGHQHTAPASKDPAAVEQAPEHLPQGNNFSSTERRSNFLESDELNQQYRPGPYGRGISLKWHPEPETTEN